ncbi:MAG: peptidoglycan editing factor PgeF, partial [Patescibacteria group bacterium]
LFFKNKGLISKTIISADLVHGNRVVVVDDVNRSQAIRNCDALITSQRNNLLTITVADCLPIYFYDREKGVVALAHAGWRGVTANIIKEVVDTFVNHYASNLGDIEVLIGPHIKDCHFEVKDDVSSQFKNHNIIIRDRKTYISLSRVVKEQLLQQGINNINISDECTYCLNKKYFSYRRDNPKDLETMIAYIGLKTKE